MFKWHFSSSQPCNVKIQMTLAEFLSIRNSKKAIKSDEKIVKRIEEALGNNKIFQGEVTD